MKLKAEITILLLLSLLLAGCPAPGYDGVTVTGTVDLAAGGTCYVELLNDTYSAVAETSGAYAAVGSCAYTLSNVLEGSYYLRVWLDFAPSPPGPDPLHPDEERYYGSGGLPTPPASPNVTVPFSGTVSYDLSF
jgi:hypothetical protein